MSSLFMDNTKYIARKLTNIATHNFCSIQQFLILFVVIKLTSSLKLFFYIIFENIENINKTRWKNITFIFLNIWKNLNNHYNVIKLFGKKKMFKAIRLISMIFRCFPKLYFLQIIRFRKKNILKYDVLYFHEK